VPNVPLSQLLGWAVAAVAIVIALVVWLRSRRPGKATEDAVLHAVHRLALAAPDLREGLNQEAADRITRHLRQLLNCVAVGITDGAGVLHSWDGEATDHYVDLEPAIASAREGHRRELVPHEKLPCTHRSSCRMRSAVIVPLIVEGRTDAVLIVVGRSRSRRLIEMADAVAQFVRTQFELARLEESKSALQQAEIKALRAQISPHFVYNALNTISSLIRTDPEEANELLLEFADFTRYSFRSSGMFTTLAEELRNVDRYLTIESARFGDRLNVRLKIAPEVLGVVVPFLIVQPLVENAVKHGLSGKPGGGTVTVIAEDAGNDAVIIVEDDGVGMDPAKLKELSSAHRTGEHVGLGNISQRMRQLFGPEYPVIVETAVGAGMKITLRVPKFAPGVRPDIPGYEAAKEERDSGRSPLLPPQQQKPVQRPRPRRLPTRTGHGQDPPTEEWKQPRRRRGRRTAQEMQLPPQQGATYR
jgi:two-component system LytT family sensor kinase